MTFAVRKFHPEFLSENAGKKPGAIAFSTTFNTKFEAELVRQRRRWERNKSKIAMLFY